MNDYILLDQQPPMATAQVAPANAAPLPQNGYKIPMAHNIIKRALTILSENG